MKRILFVDDEPRLLEGLKRMLHAQRAQWEMAFANSGAEALALLASRPFDVVVTDMRMPAMDGAELLRRVREQYPDVIRIVLSGYFETEAALRAVPVAHQFLAKPCEPEKLRQAIERTCDLIAILPDEAVRRVVGAIGQLPSLPRTCASLMAALQKPDVPLQDIGKIIEQDVGITAKVLQLVNSAFFGLVREIPTVRMAVSYLGLETLKHLVLSAEIFRTFQPKQTIHGFSLEDLQNHSRLAARIAGQLPAPKNVLSAAVVAAVLHDTGKLVLAARMPQQFEQALRVSLKDGRPLYVVEHELMGTGHAEIGAYLLGLWGLPNSVVHAVCRHHQPPIPETAGAGLDVLAITHIADALASEAAPGQPGGVPPDYSFVNLEYLTRLGVADQLAGWRSMAEETASEMAEA